MKILQLGKFWPVMGGVEKVMFDLTQGLSERGIECDMLCAASDGPTQEIRLNAKGRVVAVNSLLKAKSTMISPVMISRLRRTAADYDIIHVHHPDPMAALALYLSGYKGRVVLHWHSDILRQRILKQLYLPLQGWLLKRADTVICTSPNYAEGSSELQIAAPKLKCIPIGVAPVKPDEKRVSEIAQEVAGRKVIFSLGRLVPYKGYHNLILAARDLPDDYLVVIAGSGPLEPQLKKLIADNRLGSKVIMPGRISDRDRDAWMAVASVFCLPSVEKTEAFGIVLIESMSIGLPLITTVIPGSGTSWVNAHGISGSNVSRNCPQEIAEAAINIIDNGRLGDYRENARKRWVEKFTVGRFIDNIVNLYTSL